MDNAEILAGCAFFSQVDGTSRKRLVRMAVRREYKKGETIFRRGESSQDVYELIEGSIDLVALEREIVRLTVSRGGQIFGWSALVEPYTRTATAKCATDTRVVRIRRDSIERTIERHPHEGIFILKNLAGIIADRLRVAYSYIYSFGT